MKKNSNNKPKFYIEDSQLQMAEYFKREIYYAKIGIDRARNKKGIYKTMPDFANETIERLQKIIYEYKNNINMIEERFYI